MSQEEESEKTWNKPLIVIPNSLRCLPYIEGVCCLFTLLNFTSIKFCVFVQNRRNIKH